MREFDIVVWGATGFTGRLVCEHLLHHYKAVVRWGIAGRNRAKLENLRNALNDGSTDFKVEESSILIGNISDHESMVAIASRTVVLLSTAGPYAFSGSPVIRACIKAKTHYADINGELEWMRQVIEEFHEPAIKAGIKIVQCCGWDCTPADLGVLYITQHAEKALGKKLVKVTNIVTDIAGGFSGGTLNTALGFYAMPLKALFPHPYSLNPKTQRSGRDGQQYLGVGYEPISGLYTSPSFFAPADMRIVRRSNALLDNIYGESFRFDEAFGHPSLLTALGKTAMVLLTGLFLLLVARIPILTKWLKKRSLQPGQGPSRKFLEEGHWRCKVAGATAAAGSKQEELSAILEGQGDPGYSQTTRMLLEAGLCLLNSECSSFCLKGGVLTPASGLGMAYIDRLKAAGISFRILNRQHHLKEQVSHDD